MNLGCQLLPVNRQVIVDSANYYRYFIFLVSLTPKVPFRSQASLAKQQRYRQFFYSSWINSQLGSLTKPFPKSTLYFFKLTPASWLPKMKWLTSYQYRFPPLGSILYFSWLPPSPPTKPSSCFSVDLARHWSSRTSTIQTTYLRSLFWLYLSSSLYSLGYFVSRLPSYISLLVTLGLILLHFPKSLPLVTTPSTSHHSRNSYQNNRWIIRPTIQLRPSGQDELRPRLPLFFCRKQCSCCFFASRQTNWTTFCCLWTVSSRLSVYQQPRVGDSRLRLG